MHRHGSGSGGGVAMTPAQRERCAALRGKEFLTSARTLRQEMEARDTRPPVRVTFRCIRPRTRVRLERWALRACLLAALAAVLFL